MAINHHEAEAKMDSKANLSKVIAKVEAKISNADIAALDSSRPSDERDRNVAVSYALSAVLNDLNAVLADVEVI